VTHRNAVEIAVKRGNKPTKTCIKKNLFLLLLAGFGLRSDVSGRMKRCNRIPYLLFVLSVGLTFMPSHQSKAESFSILYNFTAEFSNGSTNPFLSRTNSDGVNPLAELLLSGTTLYGTASEGGSGGCGTVFAVNTDGTGFRTLHTFTEVFDTNTNVDGANPRAGLILFGDNLFGTTVGGGSSGFGTLFKVNIDGTGFTVLRSFSGGPGDGANPEAGLILSGNTLFGTTLYGGSLNAGTVFAVRVDGTGFTLLHSFGGFSNGGSDGNSPIGRLVLSGDTLYGTTEAGGIGPFGNGTIFTLNTNGTGYNLLYEFTPTLDSPAGYTNNDGANPEAGLILSGNTLYGTAFQGGMSDMGTVFAINEDGSGFRTLHNFSAPSSILFTNDDGWYPHAQLLLSGNTLYGSAQNGGGGGKGTVFALNTDGTGFRVLHNFAYNPLDGANPEAGLILSGNTLYGPTTGGGKSAFGTVFSISLPNTLPQLAITPSEANSILTWQTDATGFTLRSTTNLASPIWTTSLPSPVVVNGQNTVTNPISGTQRFYRLSQ
jgi:uncharacterized repeat protein (TIGR03803 family)